ncbi:glycosyltransferase [Subtercola frigoramans]|uniref:Glycosyltransferase involved in cell wall biosynthesis n=1 Tax=Subtercola frigoramans TaxID=120298 RepID=A0ABS2L8K1_9MICO|nr:glycosyltransferase [Subtercola frigoramans]MBM7473418.1 glycosyltransferase involved in cell wall biosynthesis [Subtercola frigoramans]
MNGAINRVTFWRVIVLQGTETFIRTQSDAISRWSVSTLGFKRFESALSRTDDVIVHPNRYVAAIALRWFRMTRYSPNLRKSLESLKPALVHAHFGTDAALIVPTLRKAHIPLVVSVYGFDVSKKLPETAKGRRDSKRLREAFDYSSAIIANSQFMAESAIGRGADPEKLHVVHLGIVTDPNVQQTPRQRAGILFVGRLVEKKGVSDLISAVSTLNAGFENTKLIIVGDGPLRFDLEAQAQRLGVNAEFVGSLPPATIKSLMTNALLLAVPSKTAADGDSEGLPTIILEAANEGLPIVATTHSGIPEAVKNEITGLLVPEGQPDLLAAALSRLLSDPDFAAELGAAGKRFISDEFDIRICAAKLESIYDRARSQESEGNRGRMYRTELGR